MKRMYNEQDLEQAIRRTAPGDPPVADFEAWQKTHAKAASVLRRPAKNERTDGPPGAWVIRFGRTLMEKRQVKVGAIAAVLLMGVVLVSLDRGTNVAWSMEQTIEAIEQIKTLHIEGTVVWPFGAKPGVVPFRFWVQPPTENSPLKMRGEIRNHIMIAEGDTVYECWSDSKTAQVKYGSAITDLKYWYQAAALVPWVIRELPEMIQQYAQDWKQSVDRDPNTGRERILATCTYPPSKMSFLLMIDPASKLIYRARLWGNLQFEGEPYIDAQKFVYNQQFPDELFQLPADMTIVNERDTEESRALFNRGEDLFHKEKKYTEAMAVYWQVYDAYPKLNVAEEALMMIGLCHGRLGEHEKAISVFQKAIREYPHLKGWIDATWYYLGREYTKIGQKEKALEAFENCLKAGEGVRDPEKFPLKDAREAIAKLQGE
ncbi:MAG: tetratricopeptide repeat protein [Sedimentisphaerales bacterium]|nr:tetratricopeptide repeat protein [Sedimentisphaerales bacterium]